MSVARLEEARRLAASGKLREAADLLKGILQTDPDNAAVRNMLVDLQDRMMLDLQITQMIKKASAHADKGEKEAAGKIIAEILKISPDHREAKALASKLAGSPQEPPPPPPVNAQEDQADVFGQEAGTASEFELEPTEPAQQKFPSDEEPDLVLADLEAPVAAPEVDRTVLSGPSSTLSTAEVQKIKQYTKEGQALFDAGRYQDAIDAWTRIFIIDEENRDAQTLIDQARDAMTGGQQQVEHQLTEAIAYFNSGDMEHSSRLLKDILHAYPNHREALYYLEHIHEGAGPQRQGAHPPGKAPDTESSEPTPAKSPEPPSPTFDDFEMEDSLTVPTGPEMRAGQEQEPPHPEGPSEFSFDEDSGTGGFELETGSVETPPPEQDAGSEASEEPAKPAFELETGAVDEFTFSDLDKDVGTDAGKAPPSDSASSEFGDFVWDQPLPPPSAPVSDSPTSPPGSDAGQPPAPPPMAGEATPDAGKKKAAATSRKAFSPPSASLLIILVVGLLVISLGIFFGARLLLGGGEPVPAAVTPKPPRARRPTPPPKTAPPTAQPAPEKNVQIMSTEELLSNASNLVAQKNFERAIALYQEVLGRDKANSEAQNGLREARAAFVKQQQENERNEKFLKDLGYSINSFKDRDYAESLRIAWRLIYPDDSLSRELGKRETVRELIRNGYYNWAVQDLRRGNIRGAQKNLHDLLEFDSSDHEAAKLQSFVKGYAGQQPDEAYNAVVNGLKMRSLSESP
jgi:tetratricopeptide (TPR) repeat protein